MELSKLYIGNLDKTVSEDQIKNLFESYGQVTDVIIVKDAGFGFVTMVSEDCARKAQDALDGTEFCGRTLRVNEAKPQR